MPITQLESVGQMDAVMDQLKNSSGLCIISTRALGTILQDNAKLHEANHMLNERLVASTEQINVFLQRSTDEQAAARKDLNNPFDHLIQKISSSVSSLSTTQKENMEINSTQNMERNNRETNMQHRIE